jgi:hypothetical protein
VVVVVVGTAVVDVLVVLGGNAVVVGVITTISSQFVHLTPSVNTLILLAIETNEYMLT